jgi:hypothetical protein
MFQVTMQLAALNGKELMTVKQGTLWDKATVDYFKFSSLTTINTPGLRKKFRTRDLRNTKQARQYLAPNALSYKHCISHNLQHHHTGSLLFSL